MNSAPASDETQAAGMPRLLTLLFAVASGAAVGNLYWAQPLLVQIGAGFGVSPAAAGWMITATQIGYAAGVLLIVPLGDVLDRRRLVPAVMLASALSLLAAGLAPGFGFLVAALAMVGLTTVSGQILIPLAGDLARDSERGRIVGSIVSGVLIGILSSRTISGLLADRLGWRAIYFAAAAVSLGFALTLAVRLPPDRPRPHLAYRRLHASIAALVARHPAAQVTLLIGACAFGVFTLFWTGLTFLLSSPEYGYSVSRIGMVGLVGLVGALAARRAGSLHDRGWSVGATGMGLGLALAALALAAVGERSILAVLAAVLLIDIAIQAVNVLNQTRLFSLDPASRSRLNTAFVVCNFLGGAVGSAMAGLLWQRAGWKGVMAGGAALITLALIVWLLGRRRLAAAVS